MKATLRIMLVFSFLLCSNMVLKYAMANDQYQNNSDQNEGAFSKPIVIYYGIAEYQPNENDKQLIAEKLSGVKDRQSVSFVIEGYSDPSGSESYNFKLSEKRIKGIKEILLSLGITETRIMEKAFGESKSTSTERPDFHRMRKVEIKTIMMIK